MKKVFLTLKDRSKDLIISGGTNIYPREIEEVLLKHPSIYEVAVVGKPHNDWGETVTAFVCLHEGENVTSEELDALCLDNIARLRDLKNTICQTVAQKQLQENSQNRIAGTIKQRLRYDPIIAFKLFDH